MIEKFERLVDEMDEKGDVSQKFSECKKEEATHKHICRHEEGLPCRRVKL